VAALVREEAWEQGGRKCLLLGTWTKASVDRHFPCGHTKCDIRVAFGGNDSQAS
jgi:hypothetical protein